LATVYVTTVQMTLCDVSYTKYGAIYFAEPGRTNILRMWYIVYV